MGDMLKELRERSQKRKKLLAQTVSAVLRLLHQPQLPLFFLLKLQE